MKRSAIFLVLVFLLSACGQGRNAEPSAPLSVEPAVASTVSAAGPDAPEKQVLTIARVEKNRYVTEAIEAYNDLHPELLLESQWYFDNEGALKLALAAGTGPDLMSLEMFDYEIYAEKGVFVDLNAYLDKDPELKNALVPSVLDAFRWRDGALYQIAPSYQIQSIYSVPGMIKEPWNLDTIEGWMERHPAALFTTSVESPSDLMSVLLTGYMDNLIDFKAMTCDFTSGLFARILTDSGDWAARPWTYGKLDAGAFSSQSLLSCQFQLSDFSDYKDAARMGLVNHVGYPTDSPPCVLARSVIRLAVCAGTGRENMAWEFIKSTLSEEQQKNVPWFPLRKSELDRRAAEGLSEIPPQTTEVFLDPEAAAQGRNMATATVTLPPVTGMTQEEVDMVYQIIDHASGYAGNSYTEIWSIIFDEAAVYFDGDRTAQEAAEIVQKRVTLYLSEQS